MNHPIIEQLQSFARQLAESNPGEVNLAELCRHLKDASELVKGLIDKATLADSLLQLFRDDLLARARAVARLTGTSSKLIERLISSESLSLEELLALKRDIESAFDTAFTSRLQDAVSVQTDDNDKLAQFKIG